VRPPVSVTFVIRFWLSRKIQDLTLMTRFLAVRQRDRDRESQFKT
jgi:hypothetical protein